MIQRVLCRTVPRTSLETMSCVAGAQCKLASLTPSLSTMGTHSCRGSCGGYLHGVCGAQDPASRYESHRICEKCLRARRSGYAGMGASSSSCGGSSSSSSNSDGISTNAKKKKQEQQKATGGKKRKRLSMEEKAEMVKLMENGTNRPEIARRFKIGLRTVARMKSNASNIKKAANEGVGGKAKRHKTLLCQEVDNRVMAFIDEARRSGMPVSRDVIQVFGKRAAEDIMASPDISAGLKKKVEGFSAGEKWVRNFVSRNNLKSKALHGETGSADGEAHSAHMQEIRELCSKYDISNINDVDETGLFYKLLPKRTYLSTEESLTISPVQEPGPNEIAGAQTWAADEDDPEVREALTGDAREDLMHGVQHGVEDEESDDEVGVENADKESETRDCALPPFDTVCDSLNFLEECAVRLGSGDAYSGIRQAKMAFIEAYAKRRLAQTDTRSCFSGVSP